MKIPGSTLFGTDEFSSVPFLYMMTIKKDNYPKNTHTVIALRKELNPHE